MIILYIFELSSSDSDVFIYERKSNSKINFIEVLSSSQPSQSPKKNEIKSKKNEIKNMNLKYCDEEFTEQKNKKNHWCNELINKDENEEEYIMKRKDKFKYDSDNENSDVLTKPNSTACDCNKYFTKNKGKLTSNSNDTFKASSIVDDIINDDNDLFKYKSTLNECDSDLYKMKNTVIDHQCNSDKNDKPLSFVNDENDKYIISNLKPKVKSSYDDDVLNLIENKVTDYLKASNENKDKKKIIVSSSSDEEELINHNSRELKTNFRIEDTLNNNGDIFNNGHIKNKNNCTNFDYEYNKKLNDNKEIKEIIIGDSDISSQTSQESQKNENNEQSFFNETDYENNFSYSKEQNPVINENHIFNNYEEEYSEDDYYLKDVHDIEKDNQINNSSIKESEERFLKKLQKAREVYQQMVEEALKELDPAIRKNYEISTPPVFESMSNEQMEKELEQFGFRFTNRASAISKLNRCWAAKNKVETYSQRETSPIEFIRKKSKFYEQILIYQPIPLGELFREMNDYGIKISVNQLKSLLDEEGVAFLDDNHSLHKKKNKI